MLKKIEMVCHANISRSKLAEAIANRYILENNISGMEVTSSGIYVDAATQRKAPLEFLLQIVHKGIFNSLYTPTEVGKIEVALSEGTMSVIGEYAEKAAKILTIREKQNRDYHAKKNGLIITEKSVQTIIKTDLTEIICMDENVMKGVSKIYSSAPLKPRIEVIGNYINQTPAEISMTLAVSEKEFTRLFLHMQNYVTRTIDKLNKQ